ncbi:cache domain-containing protein [Methanococcus maripaludis]|uniref:histidine kinase n=1 Tax=Methanococcus maripaludis TaxID=39152 RepID=A0A7J9RYI5_METMI|nr:cache domain-containing protein [Methanococcus maripaludis]MBB6067053.1 signal transduction histidine kinase [Methanococcus maripaludis]MBM7409342.1 signal transduction histidine kinase [Methanococcus maripaludis]MBP2220290.1 signal transduction histidine kinase [Methanococcus maripaludis]
MNTIPPIKRLGTKLIIYSIITALIPIVMLGAVSTDTINTEMTKQAQEKINDDLNTAESVVNLKLDKISSLNKYIISNEKTINILKNNDTKELKTLAISYKNTSAPDFVVFFDGQGNVVARSNSDVTGDNSYEDLFKKVVNSTGYTSIEVLDKDSIKYENVGELVNIDIKGTDDSIDYSDSVQDSAMALVSIEPIYDKNGKLLGAAMAADILNKDYSIVDTVKDASKDATTIFLDGVRVSTNVQDNGGRAIGTLVSKEVYNHVVLDGKTYYGRAFVVNEWYLTAYEPIYDSDNEIIGMLFVGTPESKFLALQANVRNQTFVVGLIGLLIALIVSYLINRGIIKPLEQLKQGAEWVSNGRYDQKVVVDSDDEFGELAKAFNKMATQINISDEKLKKHAEELKTSYNELKELDKLKSELIAIVSHELRTPLTSIKGYVELVLDGTMGTINDSQKKCLQVADDNIVRLRRLIESMLDLSKIERGELEMYREKVNLKAIVCDVIEYLKPLATEKNIKLNKEVEDIAIEADKDRITQVLTNLIENAIKFSPANESILVSGVLEDEHIHLKVTDRGAGIPKKDMEKIFNRFYQVDSSTKRKKGGSGLGLAVCKSIVEAHKGSIWVESELGKGSTFHIILPISAKDQ